MPSGLKDPRTWGKIAVGFRCGGFPNPDFVESWTSTMVSGLRSGDRVLAPGKDLPHHLSASDLIRRFLESPADSLLMMDDDMVFDKTEVSALRDNTEGQAFDILSALYVTRRPPFNPIALKRANDNPDAEYVQSITGPVSGVLNVDATGFGFILIRRKVVEKLHLGGIEWVRWGIDKTGEDIDFCRRAQGFGYRIGIDTGVRIGHSTRCAVFWNPETNAVEYEFGRSVRKAAKE